MITSELIQQATGLTFDFAGFSCLGLSDCDLADNVLTFLDSEKYAADVNKNPHIKGVFVTEANRHLLRADICALLTDDPKWCFFTLVSYMGTNKKRNPSIISPEASIHPSAVIAPEGVVIEAGVSIEPNVTIMPDVHIGEGTKIRAGAVIGVDGFEHKRTSKGLLSVVHNGEVIIGKNAEVGPNCFVSKGFSYRTTIIGDETKLDALIHYAHGVQSGKRCLIAANAMVAGNVTLGDDVWVGPSASISNRLKIGNNAFITMGSVVVRDMKAGEKVTGNFAVPHEKFIKMLKNGLKNA